MDELDEAIGTAKKSVFRFEGLQDYSSEDGDAEVMNFILTGKLGWDPKDNPWWQQVKSMNSEGVKTNRVRLAISPFTDYTKWEISMLKLCSEFSGETVNIIEEHDFKQAISRKNLPDFYVIDDTQIFIMEYGPKGKYLGSSKLEPQHIDEYLEIKRILLNRSEDIRRFLEKKF